MPPVTLRFRSPRGRARVPGGGLLFPLDAAYAQAGVPPPRAKRIAAAEIPLPFRRLLVHDHDMTPTLERYVGGRLVLRTLSTRTERHWYLRRVLLVQGTSGRPVEMGAVHMKLDAFPPAIRSEIVRHDVPLGRVLREGGVDYRSQPRAFLAVRPNAEMMAVFWMPGPRTLYGRRTDVMLRGAKVGDIVEVLPPGETPGRTSRA